MKKQVSDGEPEVTGIRINASHVNYLEEEFLLKKDIIFYKQNSEDEYMKY